MRNWALVVIFVGGAVFFNSTARGSIVSYYSGSASTLSSDGAKNAADISEYVPSEPSINSEINITFTITTTVTNQSDIIWTGYILTLDATGNAIFVEGTGESTKFEIINYPDSWTIEFREPQPVLPDEAVTLQFDINISGSAPHTFTLSHNPIPEPVTIALLGLGALALLVRRRR